MAERRMFTQKITDSDSFTEMPSSTQALYFHLNMSSDDDGFCSKINSCIFKAKASFDDLKILISKKFILPFDSGVIVIKHWRMHNLLRKDRYHETEYIDEKSQLYLKNNGSYTFDENQGEKLLKIKWQPSDNHLATEDSKGKDSKGKDCEKKNNIKRKDEKKKERKSRVFVKPTVEEVRAYCEERKNGIDAEAFVDFYISKGWMVGKNPMKDWQAAVRTWEQKRKKDEQQSKANSRKPTINQEVSQTDLDYYNSRFNFDNYK